MFGFFVNDVFSGFWSNKVGDIFCDITCEKMGWDKTQVKLYKYSNLNQNDLEHIQLDGYSVRVMSSSEQDATLVKMCEGDLFYSNGVMLIPC
jgi:hypothetical protein